MSSNACGPGDLGTCCDGFAEYEPRGGAIAIIQRFSGALNLNVQIHALVLDGVFARDPAGTVRFHPRGV